MSKPKIRFKGCQGEWESSKLNEIASFSKGHGYSKSDLKEDGSPIIMYGSMYTNYQFEINEVNSFVEQKEKSVISKGNEVIIPASGETAEDIACASAILKRDIIIGGDLNILTIGNEFSSSFIALALSNGSSHNELVKSAQGKTIVHLHNTEIAKAVVYIPPTLPEQRQIAAYFRSLDGILSGCEARLSSLRRLKEGALQAFFPQQGETQPKIRFKGCKGEWERKKLSEIASFSKGHGYSKSDLKEDGSPIIMYGSMYTNYQFEISEVHSFVEQKKESVISKGNEVIIPASGETAEDIACASAILKRDIIIGGDLNILTLGNEFSPSFIALALSNGSSHKELVKSAQGKTIVHLHNTEIAKAVVFIPPTLTEQRQIAHFFRT